MRSLFCSISIGLACSALGTGDLGGPKTSNPEKPHDSKSYIQAARHFPAADASRQVCMTEVAECQQGCDIDYAIGAAGCAMHGFSAMAAICHAANSAKYGNCLAGCR